MADNIVILEYQDNFADNFTTYTYGKILQKDSSNKCFWENSTKLRSEFEKNMDYFNLEYSYLSTSRVNNIAKTALRANDKILNKTKINKIKKSKKDKLINLKHFKIDDLSLIDDEIKENIKFKEINFIKNHDILEEIQKTNSIGVYFDKKDINNIDEFKEFLSKTTKRLNKYLKKPKLYIFSKEKFEIESNIEYKIITLNDWREEFHFLTNCKNKIIPNLKHSYSQNFWATQYNQKEYFYIAYDKKIISKTKPKNWLAI